MPSFVAPLPLYLLSDHTRPGLHGGLSINWAHTESLLWQCSSWVPSAETNKVEVKMDQDWSTLNFMLNFGTESECMLTNWINNVICFLEDCSAKYPPDGFINSNCCISNQMQWLHHGSGWQGWVLSLVHVQMHYFALSYNSLATRETGAVERKMKPVFHYSRSSQSFHSHCHWDVRCVLLRDHHRTQPAD